jgi:predicted nucleic acid-binding protein
MNKRIIIGDADALVALVNLSDSNHFKTEKIINSLNDSDLVLFPVTAIAEASTVLQRKLSSPLLAASLVDHFKTGILQEEAIDTDIFFTAISLFKPHGSKKNTLFDAIVAAVAQKYEADAIFSFDEWYSKNGFMLAEKMA